MRNPQFILSLAAKLVIVFFALALLMIYHDVQQDQADSMGAECHGNANRFEELKAHGRAIVLKDPDIWGTDVLWAFGLTRTAGVPGVRDIESERARGVKEVDRG